MTWTKLSDDFSDDCDTLDDDAFRLHVEGLNWSNRKLLDCLIPKDHLRRFATRPGALAKLVAAGWWREEGNYYRIIHHACYQRTREQVLAQQERSRKNGKGGGRPKGPPREQAPRKPRRVAQTDSQVGSEDGDSSGEKPSGKPTRVAQLTTRRDGTGLDRKGPDTNRGTELSEDLPENSFAVADLDLCHDCRERPPAGAAARAGDDLLRCRECNDDRFADAVQWPDWRGGGVDPFEEYR